MAASSRRQSKWDMPASTEGNSTAQSASQEAQERARKLTAMLAAKGKLAKGAGGPLPVAAHQVAMPTYVQSQKPDKEAELITSEVEINDSPARVILCRGTTQDEINKYSGAAVSTKGCYMDAEEKRRADNEGKRPLYLCVQGPSQDKVDRAIRRIHEIIGGADIHGKPPSHQAPPMGQWNSPPVHSTAYPPPSSTFNNQQSLPQGMHYVQDKVFVGLSHASADFNLKDKLLGPGGSYFQHIATETGAKVFLRGKGSAYLEPTSGKEAFEALNVYISHTKMEGLSAAKKLVDNLIQTVRNEYQNFEQMKRSQPIGYPPQAGYPQPPHGFQPPMYGYPPQHRGPPPPGGYPAVPLPGQPPYYGQPPLGPSQPLPPPGHGMPHPGYGNGPPPPGGPPFGPGPPLPHPPPGGLPPSGGPPLPPNGPPLPPNGPPPAASAPPPPSSRPPLPSGPPTSAPLPLMPGPPLLTGGPYLPPGGLPPHASGPPQAPVFSGPPVSGAPPGPYPGYPPMYQGGPPPPGGPFLTHPSGPQGHPVPERPQQGSPSGSGFNNQRSTSPEPRHQAGYPPSRPRDASDRHRHPEPPLPPPQESARESARRRFKEKVPTGRDDRRHYDPAQHNASPQSSSFRHPADLGPEIERRGTPGRRGSPPPRHGNPPIPPHMIIRRENERSGMPPPLMALPKPEENHPSKFKGPNVMAPPPRPKPQPRQPVEFVSKSSLSSVDTSTPTGRKHATSSSPLGNILLKKKKPEPQPEPKSKQQSKSSALSSLVAYDDDDDSSDEDDTSTDEQANGKPTHQPQPFWAVRKK